MSPSKIPLPSNFCSDACIFTFSVNPNKGLLNVPHNSFQNITGEKQLFCW